MVCGQSVLQSVNTVLKLMGIFKFLSKVFLGECFNQLLNILLDLKRFKQYLRAKFSSVALQNLIIISNFLVMIAVF
jgi:hypothetical protein